MGLNRLLQVMALTATTAWTGIGSRPLGLDLYRPVPVSNPLTPEKVALGRRLFHDQRLSRDGTMSCASCHDPSRAFSDGRTVAVGAGGARGRRNTPAIINRAWGESFFWDGRAASLESQVLQPLLSPLELGASRDRLLQIMSSGEYPAAVARAFPGVSPVDAVAGALASYVRTIVAGNSPFDQFVAGQRSALTPSARRGMSLFTGRAGCLSCHVGSTLTDERFHNTGVAAKTPDGFTDLGRFTVTGLPADRGAFKTPTLREVARTAPYMHDGSLSTLEDVVAFYDRGGQPNPYLDPKIRPLKLSTSDRDDLVAFLQAFSGEVREGH